MVSFVILAATNPDLFQPIIGSFILCVIFFGCGLGLLRLDSKQQARELNLQDIFVKNDCESGHLDYKRNLTLDTDDARAEFLKDCIALVNTPKNPIFNNKSYLCIGFGERYGRWDSTCHPISDISLLEKKIVDNITTFIRPTLNIQPFRLRYMDFDIFSLKGGKAWKDTDECMILELYRNPKVVYELGKNLGQFFTGQSWYRTGSHTKNMTQDIRMLLVGE